MIWNSTSRIRIFCTLVVIVLCAGCGTYWALDHKRFAYEDYVDLSDSATGGVATIRGTNTSVIGVFGDYCWMKSPATAKRVTVNAGLVDIVAVCVYADALRSEPVRSNQIFNAAFHFDALAGHEYEIGRKCRECIQLRDATANEVVAENPISQDGGFRPNWIEPGEEVVVKEQYVRYYECPEPYVLVEDPVDHNWLLKREVTLSCVTPGSEKTMIEPGEEVKVLGRRYVRFYECPEPYVIVERAKDMRFHWTLTCEEPGSSNDE